MSPQLRDFLIPQEHVGRIDAISDILNRFKDPNYNFSNTARTVDKLMQHVPGSALGVAGMIMGHNPALSFMLGKLTSVVSKDAPDAIRLAMLKWMSTNRPIEAGAFKAMSDYMSAAQKGDALMSRSAKAVFKPGADVLPESKIPTAEELASLDKKVQKMAGNPSAGVDAVADASYYLPDHGVAMSSTSSNVVNYLNGIRPTATRGSPLDAPMPPSDAAIASYNRALTIAQQPLTVLNLLKQGRLTPEDANHLRAMYPQLYNKINQNLTDELINHTSKGNVVPYSHRGGLSILLGQPMDSSFKPQNIQTNQQTFMQNQVQPPGAGASPKLNSKGMENVKISDRFSLSPKDSDE